MKPTPMELQRRPMESSPTEPLHSSMNPSFLPLSGPGLLQQFLTLTTECPHLLFLTLFLRLHSMAPSLMSHFSESLAVLLMCISRRTRDMDFHLIWRSLSLLDILHNTKGGSS